MKNKVLLLVKLQLMGILGINKLKYSQGKKVKHIAIAIAAAIGIIVISAYIAGTAFMFSFLGFEKYVMPLMMMLVSVLIFTSTFFKSNGFLFGAKDNDILMSLPIKGFEVVASRFLTMYVFNLFFIIITLLPSYIVLLFLNSAPLYSIPFFILSAVFVPFIPMIASSIIGAIITFISARFKYSNAVGIFISLSLAIGVVVLSFAPMGMSGEFNEENIDITAINQYLEPYLEKALNIYPISKIYQSLMAGDVISLLSFIAITLVLLLCFVWVISKVYFKIDTIIYSRKTAKSFKINVLKSSSILKALYKKEFKRYFSSTLYVINTAIGSLMLVAAAIGILFIPSHSIEAMFEIQGMSNLFGRFLPLVSALCISMACTAASSVSLEGKHIWMLTSSPISPDKIYLSKIAVNLTITLPAIFIAGILFAFSGYMNVHECINAFLFPSAFALFSAVLGVFTNLKFLNLQWTNETTVIKQSASVFIAIFSGFILIMPAFYLLVMFSREQSSLIISIYALVIMLITTIIYIIISKKDLSKVVAKL